MSKDNIDVLFKEGLNQKMHFTNEEEQWLEVQKKLNSPRKRKVGWIWFSGILLLFISVMTLPSIQKSTREAQISSSRHNNVDYQNNNTILKQSNDKNVSNTASSENMSSNNIDPQLISDNVSIIDKDFSTESIDENNSSKRRTDHKDNYPNYNDSETPAITSNISNTKSIIARTYPSTPNTFEKTHESKNIEMRMARSLDTPYPIPSIRPSVSHKATAPKMESSISLNPVAIEKQNLIFSIEAGLTTDFLGTGLFSNARTNNPYFGLNIGLLDKLNFSMIYSSRSISRKLGQNLLDYNVPSFISIYQPEIADTTNIRYSNKSFDLNVAYSVLKNRLGKLSIGVGAQINKNESHNIVYIYGDEYSIVIEEAMADEQDWHISDFTTGINIVVPISRRFSIESRYQYHIPRNTVNYKWSKRHRILIGLRYNFKK